MLTKWNLFDEQKVRNNPSEIRVCNCFLHLAIKYSQKNDIVMNKFESDLLKLGEEETETFAMFFSDIYVVCCYDAFFGFTDSGAWYERYN